MQKETKETIAPSQELVDNLPAVIHPEPILVGTPRQAQFFSILVWFLSFWTTVIVSPLANSMNQLSSPLKLLLIALSGVPGMSLQIFTNCKIDENGGMRTIKTLRSISSLGALGLLLFSAATDLTTIDAADWRYALLVIFSILSNFGSALYALIGSILFWSAEKNRAHNIAMYGGIGGLGPGIALIVLQFALSGAGLNASLGIFFCISLLATGLTFFRLVPDFYHQLLSQHFPDQEARQIAQAHGQFFFPVKRKQTIYQTLWNTLRDSRCLTSMLNAGSSSGAALWQLM